MLIFVVCVIVQMMLLAYLNVRACMSISKYTYATEKMKKIAKFIVWVVPVLGILVVGQRLIPNFYKCLSGATYYGGGGGYSGGDCG
jgi:hypothetical protein